MIPRVRRLLIVALVAIHLPAAAAEAPVEELRSDTDPTKPVLFSLRNEYFNLKNNAWINQSILRMDRLVFNQMGLPGGAKGSILRFDLPYAMVNNGRDTQSGLSDIYGQALLIPTLRKGFTIAYGSGLVAPTAVHRALGSGQWQLAPALIPAQFFPRRQGLAYIKVQDFVSFAGAEDRAAIHQLQVTPTLLRRITRRWYFLIDSETKTDWLQNTRTSAKSGLMTGWMISPRLGGWVKVEVPWGENRTGDWTLKTTLFATRF